MQSIPKWCRMHFHTGSMFNTQSRSSHRRLHRNSWNIWIHTLERVTMENANNSNNKKKKKYWERERRNSEHQFAPSQITQSLNVVIICKAAFEMMSNTQWFWQEPKQQQQQRLSYNTHSTNMLNIYQACCKLLSFAESPSIFLLLTRWLCSFLRNQ